MYIVYDLRSLKCSKIEIFQSKAGNTTLQSIGSLLYGKEKINILPYY